MMKKVLQLLAACTLLFSAVPAFAAAPDPTQWLGDWVFTYSDNGTENVTFTDVCVSPDCPGDDSFEYIAKGKKSDDTSIMILKINAPFLNTKSMYFEVTDAEFTVCQLKCPSATIPDSNYLACGAFKVSATTETITLVSGKKADAADTCTFTTTTTTVRSGNICTAAKLLGADNPKLAQVRDFRDSALARTLIGRKIIHIYYSNADSINAAFDRSPILLAAARRVLEAIAPVEN
jgi:hypothetical protein